jgi:hypothetical protein
VRRIGHAIHLLSGGVKGFRIVVILLLLLLLRRRNCVVRGLGVCGGCFWLGLGCLSYGTGGLWLSVFSIVPWK